MHGSYSDFGNCKGTCPEFFDGRVAFHYTAGPDSEYLHIRWRFDPFPQSAMIQVPLTPTPHR